MKRLVASMLASVLVGTVAACGGGGPAAVDPPDAAPPARERDCRASDQSFVRQASLALLGRRPRSQAETLVYTSLMEAVRALPAADGPFDDSAAEAREAQARRAVVRALMRDPAFVARWTRVFMDVLRVQRIDDQAMRRCYTDLRGTSGDASVAAYVRDNPASAGPGDASGWNMRELLESSIRLDDLSPALRGHLFALVAHTIPAANVPAEQAEIARREDSGTTFEAVYLNRDMVCLGCHNSGASVTFDEENPSLNRHWALPGLFEQSLYGDSFGIDPKAAHAVFRYDGFADGPSTPWGWDDVCGSFERDVGPDIAGIEGKFGDITGQQTTVYDLEDSLRRGVDALAANGLQLGSGGDIADPDQAFAYLVGASVANAVWREVMGQPLTIANYFPRNRAQRDQLFALTERFTRSHFSLEELLLATLESPYFARALPEEGCGAQPYELANVWNPWVLNEPDETTRWNSAADGIHPLGARTLTAAVHEALGWAPPMFSDFPYTPGEVGFCLGGGSSCAQLQSFCESNGQCCSAVAFCEDPSLQGQPEEEQAYQRGVGYFLKNGERGFRGLDFQARLVFEERYGACANPGSTPDFIDDLVARAAADGRTVEDVVVALKDRLVGEPAVVDPAERAALEALLGAPLASGAAAAPELGGGVRRLCGVLLATPQFLLGGIAAPDAETVPALTPADVGFDALCAEVAARGVDGLVVECRPDGTVGVTE